MILQIRLEPIRIHCAVKMYSQRWYTYQWSAHFDKLMLK